MNTQKDTCSNNSKKCGYRHILFMKKKCWILMLGIFFMITPVFILHYSETSAQTNTVPTFKYFKSIEICEGDSLWKIAEQYMSAEYKSIHDYIKELRSMNGLSDDTIHAGRNLVIAYYSTDLK